MRPNHRKINSSEILSSFHRASDNLEFSREIPKDQKEPLIDQITARRNCRSKIEKIQSELNSSQREVVAKIAERCGDADANLVLSWINGTTKRISPHLAKRIVAQTERFALNPKDF